MLRNFMLDTIKLEKGFYLQRKTESLPNSDEYNKISTAINKQL